MSVNSGSNLYSQGFGATSSSSFPGNAIVQPRPPSSQDVIGPVGNYKLGQLWVDSAAQTSWQLVGLSSNNTITTATWAFLGSSGSSLDTLSGDTGVAVPSAGNIQIAGNGTITTSAAGSTVTINAPDFLQSIGVEVTMAPGVDPVVPNSSGNIEFSGLLVESGSTPNSIIIGSVAPNEVVVAIQKSDVSASPDDAKNGVCHFDSADFDIDSDGFVTLVAGPTGAITQLLPNSGTIPVIPNGSGQVTLVGSGSITTVGGINTLTVQVTGLTNHNVLVGAASDTITKVAPSNTAGIPLVSNGSSADPSFTTAVVAGGGTGGTSFTANSPICAGTTTTAAFQAASSGISNVGYVLTSTGASSVPTWQASSGGSGVIITIDGDFGSVSAPTVGIKAASAITDQGTSTIQTFSATVLGLVYTAGSNTCLGSGCANGLNGASNTSLGSGSFTTNANVSHCTAIGDSALHTCEDFFNTAIGSQSMKLKTAGGGCTAVGYLSLLQGTGESNTVVGEASLSSVVGAASRNTVIGSGAASNYTSDESDNIIIGEGVGGNISEDGVLRIGQSLNKAFISGVRGATTDNPDAIPVLVDSLGQLGTASSSVRYKTKIEPILNSERIYNLTPVTFLYRDQLTDKRHIGLIAEEVHEHIPEIVVKDKNGQIDTVQYQYLPILLLSEIKNLKKEIDELKNQLKARG